MKCEFNAAGRYKVYNERYSCLIEMARIVGTCSRQCIV